MFLSRFFGQGKKIRKLRKRWDRQRERTLKTDEPVKSTLLKRLDQIELNLRTLEEQKIRNTELARIAKEIEIDLEETKAILDSKNDYVQKEQQNISYQE